MSSGTLKPAERGNDGNLNNLAHTEREANPWWQIDFGSSKLVGAITFHDRDGDYTIGSCASRLFVGFDCRSISSSSSFTGADQGATFGVGDTPCSGDNCSSPQCGHLTTPASGAYTITCDPPLQGRYAYVMLPGSNRMLNFMEFEAHEGEHRCMLLCRLLCARHYALGV